MEPPHKSHYYYCFIIQNSGFELGWSDAGEEGRRGETL
jgi:hypothetical protein